jgi:hypothetical protein
VHVQVILGQVAERGDPVVEPDEALHGEGRGGGLHDDVLDPRLGHAREDAMELAGGGRREARRESPTGEAGVHRADDPGAAAGGGEHGLDEVGGGGLAVGAGHADERHPVGGPPQPAGDQQAERRDAGGHDDLRQVDRKLFLDDQRRGPALGGGAGEAVTVDRQAAHGHEDLAGREPARIVGDPADRDVGADEARTGHVAYQLAELHGSIFLPWIERYMARD